MEFDGEKERGGSVSPMCRAVCTVAKRCGQMGVVDRWKDCEVDWRAVLTLRVT